jgi:hypothetical protein
MNGAGFDPKTPTYGRKSRGATAGMARKHCIWPGCGRTLPNRARSQYCGVHYEAGVHARDLVRRRDRRARERTERVVRILETKGHG